MPRPMRQFAAWTRSTRCAKAFGRQLPTVCPPASALRCSAPTTGSCRASSIWRKNSAPARFPFSRSMSPIRMPSAARMISSPTWHCSRRTCRSSSKSWIPWSEIMRRTFAPVSSRRARRSCGAPSILRRHPRAGGLPSGSLQCAGVFRRHRRDRPRAAVLFHLGALGCTNIGYRRVRCRHASRQRSRRRAERRRHECAAHGDSRGRARRMQDLRLLALARSRQHRDLEAFVGTAVGGRDVTANLTAETLAAYERWAPLYPPTAHNPLMRAEQHAMLDHWPRRGRPARTRPRLRYGTLFAITGGGEGRPGRGDGFLRAHASPGVRRRSGVRQHDAAAVCRSRRSTS